MAPPTPGESSRGLVLLLLVVLGGALGGLLRWGAGEAVADAGRPVDLVLLAINVGGAFTLGLLPGVLTHVAPGAREPLAAFLGPGLLGGFTTLSAIEVASRSLLADGEPVVAALQLAGTLVCAVAAVAVARRVARSTEGGRSGEGTVP